MTSHRRFPADRCTVRMAAGGMLCGKTTMRGTPFPICKDHAATLYTFLLSEYPQRDETWAEQRLAEIEVSRERYEQEQAERKAKATASSVVYYLRMGEFIKIGTSCDVAGRMRALYVDPEDLLITEQGGRAVERRRHLEFAEDRVRSDRELFHPSDRLLAHIEHLKAAAA